MRAWYSIIIFLGGFAPRVSGQQLAKLVASDAAEGDAFGKSVAISGDLVVVGAWFNDDAGDLTGSAYDRDARVEWRGEQGPGQDLRFP